MIAEQHLALTNAFHSPRHFTDSKVQQEADFVGEIFLRCNAKEVVENCAAVTKGLMHEAYGPSCRLPEVKLQGHLDATFPYILSHLEYIIGELLRNSFQGMVEQRRLGDEDPPPIEVLICESPHHVILRISDQGGGVPREILPHLWSFSKGPRRDARLENLNKVPKMAATMQEVKVTSTESDQSKKRHESSLSRLSSRPPNLRLGIGLPMSRIYAEYWAGSLELHSLEGYGVDVFLQIPKLGNKNEQLTTRASMDAV